MEAIQGDKKARESMGVPLLSGHRNLAGSVQTQGNILFCVMISYSVQRYLVWPRVLLKVYKYLYPVNAKHEQVPVSVLRSGKIMVKYRQGFCL